MHRKARMFLTIFAVLASPVLFCANPGGELALASENQAGVETVARVETHGGGSAGQKAKSVGWEERVITEEELEVIAERDPDLSPSVARGILARINVRARYYIAEDIKQGRALRVPHDFQVFKHWTPMPKFLRQVAHLPKFVLITKDIPFAAWYENGRLQGDAEVCIGKKWGWTRAGVYRIDSKIIDAVSLSYRNAYGEPAPMPYAMRIYDHVYVHAGDIASGYCSHGCINLPIIPAKNLFNWADRNTVVAVIESLESLERFFAASASNCLLFPSACRQTRIGRSEGTLPSLTAAQRP